MSAKVVINVKDLVKKYKTGEKPAVDHVSLRVKQGEFFTFLGPNGAGKTTTISVLTTTLSKTSGEVMVAGFNTETEAAHVRKRVGIIFQKPSLDENLTAEENVRFHTILYGMYGFSPSFGMMPKEYKDKVERLASLLGIEGELGQPIKTFSGGMKRKLEIVRSLMHDPEVLFLDEPTTGLDPESRRNLWDYLQDVRKEQGTTVFLTTHYLDEAEGADRVCVINKGKISFEGTPRELKSRLLKEYVLMDAGDRDGLQKELEKRKFSFEGKGPFKVSMKEHSAQEIIQGVKMELSVLNIHNPSLEEAYLALLGSRGARGMDHV